MDDCDWWCDGAYSYLFTFRLTSVESISFREIMVAIVIYTQY